MSVLNTPRFRVHKGRVYGFDMANVVTRFMTLAGDANAIQYFDIGSGAGTSASPIAADYPETGQEGGLVLQNLNIVSGAGAATTHVMIGGRLRNDSWKMYTWDNSATTATDVTDDAQGDGDPKVSLALAGTANDGFVIAASGTFDTIIANIFTATAGAATVEEFSYWNGSSWAAVSIRDSKYPAAAPGHFDTTGWSHVRFEPPGDWEKTTGATAEGGVATGMYALRYRTTTVCTTAAIADKIRVGSTLRFCVLNVKADEEVIADNMNVPITSGFESPWIWTETAIGDATADATRILTVAYTAERTAFAGSLGV